jgi:glycolate oxidase FAD binding subunit
MMVSDEAALAEALASAPAPMSVRGGGTRGMAGPGEALEVSGMSGITLYEPGALTMVARAGTPLAEVDAALSAEGQRLAFEPMDHRALLGTDGTPTIGGVFAANVSGPRRIAVGAARDFLLGVRFVDGAGRVVSNGGRVMKNVTGYDLVKLMAGSHGTLGVLSEVSFKVLPAPEAEATLVLPGLDAGVAVAAMACALGSPFEVTGAAHVAGKDAGTRLRIEGFAESVRYRAGALRERLAGFGTVEVMEGDASAATWARVRDLGRMAGTDGDVWRVHCRPGLAPGLVAEAGAEDVQLDWGGGLIWLRMAPGTDLRARLGAFDGHAALVRARAETLARLGRFHPEPPGVRRLTEGLRARFDPRGVLNAGLMAPAAIA